MTSHRSFLPDLITAAVAQAVAFLLAAIQLDMGQWMSATIYLSFGFWLGACVVLVRRGSALTRWDRLYLRYGLAPIIVVGVPVFLYVWSLKGVT